MVVRFWELVLDVDVVDCHHHQRCRKVEYVKNRGVPLFVEHQSAPVAEPPKDPQWYGKQNIFVQEIFDKVRISKGEPPALDQQQISEALELAYRKITGQHRILPLLPINPDPDIRHIDHIDIIRAITNCQRGEPFIPDQFYQLGFLLRRGSTANHRGHFH
jgi:hypothetical protein